MSKKKADVRHLARWFYGNFCVRCAVIDGQDYGRGCWDKLHQLAENIGFEELTHREFVKFVREGTTFCKPTPRKFEECPICKALGVPQQR